MCLRSRTLIVERAKTHEENMRDPEGLHVCASEHVGHGWLLLYAVV